MPTPPIIFAEYDTSLIFDLWEDLDSANDLNEENVGPIRIVFSRIFNTERRARMISKSRGLSDRDGYNQELMEKWLSA